MYRRQLSTLLRRMANTFKEITYSPAEKAEIKQWTTTSSHIASPTEDQAKTAERLSSLNRHLSTRTTVLGSKPSTADTDLYERLAPVVSKWSSEERTGEQGYHHIVRHLDFVQNSSLFGLKLDEKVAIDPTDVKFAIKPIDPKAEKERKKKEKELAAATSGETPAAAPVAAEAAAASGPPAGKEGGRQKKEKKEKAPKAPKSAPAEKPLSPSLIDLRVGHILKAVQHPDAEKLFVSTIAVGDAPGTDNTTEYEGKVVRTVCSGLNGLIPLEEMQGRKIVAVCNLKPVTMRGVKSSAMVLAASPRDEEGHGGPVELVNPPEGAEAGERVFFDGWEGEPEGVLNPKKKIWETFQPGFTTTDNLEVGFDVVAVPQLAEKGSYVATLGILKTKHGICTVKSLKGATVR